MHNVLVLSAHTDDAELGCGGTIAKHVEKGDKVWHVAFSSLPKDKQTNETNVFETEFEEAIRVLGIQNYSIYCFPMREFPQVRQNILDELIRIKNEHIPSIVYVHSSYDTHQDHKVLREEAFRVFKYSTMLGYELPWNNTTFATDAFSLLTDSQMDKKLEAVNCYKSQIGNYPYFDDDYIKSLARTRGMQIGVKYAEAFEVIRWVF